MKYDGKTAVNHGKIEREREERDGERDFSEETGK